MILPLVCCILIPVYYYGGSQEVNPKTFWSKIQITMVEDGSIFCLVPVLMCLMLSILLMKFYKEFQILYIYYKQLVARRAAPQNYTVLLDCIPKELQKE